MPCVPAPSCSSWGPRSRDGLWQASFFLPAGFPGQGGLIASFVFPGAFAQRRTSLLRQRWPDVPEDGFCLGWEEPHRPAGPHPGHVSSPSGEKVLALLLP